MRRLLPLALLVGAAGCQIEESFQPLDPGFNRMLEVPRMDPYEPGAMARPPEGTVTYDPRGSQPDLASRVDGRYRAAIPLAVDRAFLERGRRRFEAFCAVCHGVLGDGDTVVAQRMSLRKPPSLHEPRIRRLPVGELHAIARDGYGLMPGYAAQLDARDRWAVAAYVQALQLSQRVPVSELTPAQRSALPGPDAGAPAPPRDRKGRPHLEEGEPR